MNKEQQEALHNLINYYHEETRGGYTREIERDAFARGFISANAPDMLNLIPAEGLMKIDKVRELVETIDWLKKDHDVCTKTKDRSDYWANQFRLVRDQCRTALAPFNDLEVGE